MKSKFKSIIMLFTTSIIWGIAFVAQSEGINYVGTFTFSAIRFFLAGIVLLPFLFFILSKQTKTTPSIQTDSSSKPLTPYTHKEVLVGGILCGLTLFVACNLQQFGLMFTSVGKSGFVTAMYIVFCPLICLFFGKKSSKTTIAPT